MVLVDINPNIALLVSFVSMIDISLTYFLLWIDKNIFPDKPKFAELNPIAKWTMKKTNYGPIGLLIGSITTQAILWGFFYGYARANIGEAIATMYFFFGAIFVAVWMHVYNIKRVYKLPEFIAWQSKMKAAKDAGKHLDTKVKPEPIPPKKPKSWKGIRWLLYTNEYDNWSEGLKAFMVISIFLTLPLWVIGGVIEYFVWGKYVDPDKLKKTRKGV